MEKQANNITVGKFRFELDNYPQGWTPVKPGTRPRHHRREWHYAQDLFGLRGRRDIWWLPIDVKFGDKWAAQDAGLKLPEYVPLFPGQRVGEVVYTDYASVREELVEVHLVLRFPQDEAGLCVGEIPAYWYKGRRRKKRRSRH